MAWCFLRGMKHLSILLVGVALLVGGCGEKEVTESKQAKEKTVADEMPAKVQEPVKASSREVSRTELEERDGVLYFNGETEPFTGIWIGYNKDGSKFEEGPIVDGKIHGMVTRYLKDGSTKTEKWVHGAGTKIEYYEDGKKHRETSYVDGKRDGTLISYRNDGSKWGETAYVGGKMHGTQVLYNEDGSKDHERPFVKGKSHGTEIGYNKDGSKWTQEYKDGRSVFGSKNGTEIRYYSDGTKKKETCYVNGKYHGTEIWYYEDGSKKSETVYENGKVISRKDF